MLDIFENLAGNILAFSSCMSILFSGMEFNVDSIIEKRFLVEIISQNWK